MRELGQLAERKDAFARLGISVYALAPQTVGKLESLQEDLGDGVTLLSDPEGDAVRAFGVMDRFGLPRAASFLVDREGRVKHRWLADNYRRRVSPDDILATARG